MDNQEFNNSRHRRKEEAKVANSTMEIAENIMPIGECLCSQKGNLFMYLKSNPENIYQVYCDKCEVTSDLREFFDDMDVKLYYPPQEIMNILIQKYGIELIEQTQLKPLINEELKCGQGTI